MSEELNESGDAGVRFPFINLEKAISRTKQLYDQDHQGREMPVMTAFDLWGYSLKSSGGHQTVAALKMYGLIKDSGALANRKIGLTENALRYFKDEREEERLKLLQIFALSPKLIHSLWSDGWGASPPADPIARSTLKLERKLSEQNARSLLGIYKENLELANLKGEVKIQVRKTEDASSHRQANLPEKVRVGEYVQWSPGGINQFDPPRKVEWISPDKTHLRVFGSPTGVPMSEVTVVDPAVQHTAKQRSEAGDNDSKKTAPDIDVYQRGGRLQITADVDLEGIKTLKEVLQKYEEVLKLLN